ncbi:DNA-binding NarL/FixJ family response regulator [Actinokineospora baliensis]|uniref:response regulator transcription factor n=1 Tax=Actinokineospora baliensis TaxID=547056 RepID=UPI0027DD792F|nr:response regulator transcription factor [Actinokineospora baliensis]MBM7773896.1 DNA-binding NarL/FixJ family response regulator [Actinokineospora baliensis]
MAEVTPVRLVVVDDDPLVRAGLRMILGGAPDIDVVGEAADGRAAIDLVDRERPDVVLMDIRMPGVDGLAAARALRDRASASRVIVLTTFDTDDMVLAALRDGAAGFLLKDTDPTDLIAAIHRVARGEPMLSPSVTARLIAVATRQPGDDPARRTAHALLGTLTARERQVAAAVAEGLSNTEIAQALHLGVATVKTHVAAVFGKLAAANRVQVARRVHDAGPDWQEHLPPG